MARAASFLAGLALLALVDASGLEVYEDQPAVHVVAHVSGAALTLAGAAVVAVRTGATTRMTTSPSRRAVLGEGSVGGPA